MQDGGGDKQVEPDGVRARIIAAARDEFAARGLEASSVRTIGARAGVTPAMINYYFGGKRALCDVVVAEAQSRLHARLTASMADGPSATRLAAAYFDFLAEDGQMQRLLLREILDGGIERFPELVRPLSTLLTERFGGAAAAQVGLSLFGAIAGYFIYASVLGDFVEGGDALSPEALAIRRRHVLNLVATLEGGRP